MPAHPGCAHTPNTPSANVLPTPQALRAAVGNVADLVTIIREALPQPHPPRAVVQGVLWLVRGLLESVTHPIDLYAPDDGALAAAEHELETALGNLRRALRPPDHPTKEKGSPAGPR